MPYIKTNYDSRDSAHLHYHDFGDGQPIVLIHGWPLSERSWEKQVPVLLAKGYRVIAYDRRGFGESSKSAFGYNYDTLVDDLNALMTQLDLRDAILIGFSMGCGEVARYIGTYSSGRVAKAVFISGILPALLKTDDNLDGIEGQVFEDIMDKIVSDRPKFLTGFFNDFYSHNVLGTKQVSEEVLRFSWLLAVMASPMATLKCVSAWLEDFRADVARIDIPTLIIHGDSDRILPVKATAHRLKAMIPGCEYVEISGGPHGIIMSHPDEVNDAIIKFLDQEFVMPGLSVSESAQH